MDAMQLLRMQAQTTHGWLENTLGDVTEEQAHQMPAGRANSVAVSYAHAVVSEDMIVNGMLRGQPPLMATSWAGKTGLNEMMPSPGPEWVNYFDWTRRAHADLAQLRQYAQAVYANTDEWLATVKPEDLDREVEIPGLGKQNLGWAISVLVVGHMHDLTGEVSAIKGTLPMTGYNEGFSTDGGVI